MSPGFFEIGIFQGKTPANVGTLWRSAFQLGADGIFTVGKRYQRQATDTTETSLYVPCRDYTDIDALLNNTPQHAVLVGVEMGGKSLPTFKHPPHAIYLLGAEDFGLPKSVLKECAHVVSLPAIRTASYNVAIAGSLVMFDRAVKTNAFQTPTKQVRGE